MEIFRALAVLAEPPKEAHAPIARALGLPALPERADHTDCFDLRFYPYASVYLGPEGWLGGVARDRVAGFWRALGMEPPSEPDELVILLAFYSGLAERATARDGDRRDAVSRARSVFFHEHVLSWLPVFLHGVARVAPPYYRRWASLLMEALAEEEKVLPRAPTLPLHLRTSPPDPDPATARLDDILGWLLAPVRSGVVLVRDDLLRVALDLGVGARANDRRTLLRGLLGEAPAEILSALGQEARYRADTYRKLPGGAISDWWSRRALSTARLLDHLTTTARSAGPEDRALSPGR